MVSSCQGLKDFRSSVMEATMRWIGRILPLLCFVVPASLSAADNPNAMVRAYVASRSMSGHLIVVPASFSATDNLNTLLRTYIASGARDGHLPSFARQTGLACSACHYQFLTLTPFGRQFKRDGYTLTNQTSLVEKDSANGGKLGLNPFSVLSAMINAGVTHTKDDVPDTQNDAAALPQ